MGEQLLEHPHDLAISCRLDVTKLGKMEEEVLLDFLNQHYAFITGNDASICH